MTGFTWQKQKDKALAKKLYRLQRELATNHPDKLISMPNECKQQKNKEPLLKHCAEKVIAKHESTMRFLAVPPIKREPRFNRYG